MTPDKNCLVEKQKGITWNVKVKDNADVVAQFK